MTVTTWTPPIGHNRPAFDLATTLSPIAIADLLAAQLQPHRDRCNELLAADERFAEATAGGIEDDTTAGRATDFIRQLKAAAKATDQCREAIKAPVLAAQRQIDGEAKQITAQLEAATVRAEGRVKAYLRQKEAEARARAQEEARLREEEAARLIAEAEATDAGTEKALAAIDAAEDARRAAAASATDLSRTRTTLGGVASLRQNWTYSIEDKIELLHAIVAGEVSADYVLPNDAMLKALARSQKDKAWVPGVRFYNDAGVTIR